MLFVFPGAFTNGRIPVGDFVWMNSPRQKGTTPVQLSFVSVSGGGWESVLDRKLNGHPWRTFWQGVQSGDTHVDVLEDYSVRWFETKEGPHVHLAASAVREHAYFSNEHSTGWVTGNSTKKQSSFWAFWGHFL